MATDINKKRTTRKRSERQKFLVYERCVVAIGDLHCDHKDALPGSGAILKPPCPVCLCWCALNADIAEKQLFLAKQMWEAIEKRNREKKLELVKPKIEVVRPSNIKV